MGLGTPDTVSLTEARERATAARREWKAGGDPVEERRQAHKARRKARERNARSFEAVARQCYAEHRDSWRNPKYTRQWITTLETYVFPTIGSRAIDEIGVSEVRDVLGPIWLEKQETARRVRQRINTVIDYAVAKEWRPIGIAMPAVTKGLPKQKRSTEHHAAMDWRKVPGFVATMGETLKAGEPVRLALEFLILTAARSGEVRGMSWAEINQECTVWTVPADRMKNGRAHRVPLSERGRKILVRMWDLRQTDDPDSLIFPGAREGRPLSDMSLTMPLRRSGLEVTAHGFRSAFRDWCAEATETPREVAEAALAHINKNKVEAAYARTDHFERRCALMEDWATFVTGTTLPHSDEHWKGGGIHESKKQGRRPLRGFR